jgi:hypothetical protein
MIVRILSFLVLAFVVALFAVWLLNGGWSKAVAAARSFNPLNLILSGGPLGSDFRLPGQPVIPAGADISQYTGGEYDIGYADDYADLAQQVDDLEAQVSEARTFASVSPYAAAVTLRVENPGTPDEFAVIEVNGDTAVSTTGWSLQSAVTRTRVPLPHAASAFVVGAANTIQPVKLSPGTTIIAASGPSPVSVSFRENICSGYLGQLQHYAPPFPAICPAPLDSIPATPETVAALGESCFDYLASVPSCTFPGGTAPGSLTSACRATIAERLTYNGCVRGYSSRADFTTNRWRLFLDAHGPLWQRSRDAVRLLDAQGRTVATYSY